MEKTTEIILKITKGDMDALINIIDCASSALAGEVEGMREDIIEIDKALVRNGYKRKYK